MERMIQSATMVTIQVYPSTKKRRKATGCIQPLKPAVAVPQLRTLYSTLLVFFRFARTNEPAWGIRCDFATFVCVRCE